MNRNKKMIVRGCNLLLIFAILLWVIMIGVDYFLTMNQFKAPFFAGESSEVVDEEGVRTYEGIGYSVDLTYMPASREEEKLSKVDFYIFQRAVSHVVLD